MSSTALVIPARLGSTRLARKALADIHGSPMVVRVAQRASLVKGVSRIIVATDSDEIVAAVKKAGFETAMTPSELKSGTDRVAYVARNLSEEIIINLQGDEPVMPPEAVEAAMAPVISGRTVMGSVMTKFSSREEFMQPSNVKVLIDKNNDAIYFSRHPIPFRMNEVSDADLLSQTHLGKHMGIYVYRKDFLQEFSSWNPVFLDQWESLEQLRALYHGVKIGMGFTAKGSQSVDTQEDLDKARAIFKSL